MSRFKLCSEHLPESLQQTLECAAASLSESWSDAELAELESELSAEYSAQLATVLATSPFVCQQFERQPQMLLDLLVSGDLHQVYSASRWRQKLDALVAEELRAEAEEVLRDEAEEELRTRAARGRGAEVAEPLAPCPEVASSADVQGT